MNQVFMKWCLLFAASTDFTRMPDQLREMLSDAFSGWLQSRVNEKGNKVMRDAEKRNNASQARQVLFVGKPYINKETNILLIKCMYAYMRIYAYTHKLTYK